MKILEKMKKMYYYIIDERKKERAIEAMDAIKLSGYVIQQFNNQKKIVTNLKLQKVMYYIQGYFFKNFGYAAFEDEIRRWHYGPVVPIVYYEYNSNGAAPLKCQDNVDIDLYNKERNLIQTIVKKCAGINTATLVEMTHHEEPWEQTEAGALISTEIIKNYFEKSNPLRI